MTAASDNPNAKLPYPRERLTPSMVQQFAKDHGRTRRFKLAVPYLLVIGAPFLLAAIVFPVLIIVLWPLLLVCIAIGIALEGTSDVRDRIIKERLCLKCGYCMQYQRTDGTGIGRCPECGELFNLKLYTIDQKE